MNETRIALVTGGSRGLGRDMALSLARKGLDIILTYRSKKEEADEVVKQIEALGRKALSLPLDMNAFSSLEAFVKALIIELKTVWQTEAFDYLVNNAGMGATVPFEKVTETLFDEFLNVHFKSVYFLTQKLLPHLKEGGGIVNISSGTTRFANPGYSVYASMKGAIEVLTKYWAKELGPKGIRANVVAPGPVETDFNNAAIRSNPQMKERLAGLSPLGRVGTAEDIGSVVAFLCTDEAKWINGQRIEVSGGING
ncbi:SDR family NAD(P)-dependent oxidoreductase [Flavisolibacter ginsenosidimutans]|uniref:SDR family oxidoreductase n=1 Tax=Flavisolibacter ginsenosidimutans TaxID=661481 RepID=A0A5B8UL51_9BACT|nr:SDR family oxidoreductase [Flavisolibacter ginsenosidimutans]QEC57397.1 SDR family oxidoreductase [Flavisolibacter ginsenosidimutans]